MMKTLTEKQKRVIASIQDLKRKLGKSPTLEEIRENLGYSGISSVQRHIDTLKRKGYLSNDKYQARTLEVEFPKKMVNIPLVGNVSAGKPLLAEENIEAYIPYNKTSLKGNASDYFFLKAVGDSMNNTNIANKKINSGDFVLVRKQSTADSGSRIVALIGDEATIKKMVKGDGYIRLEPESTNSNNKPIILIDNLLVQGIVVDVLKKEGDS